MRITLEAQSLTVELTETEARIAEKTWPLLAPMLEMQIRLNIRIMLGWVTLGRDTFMSYIRKVENGEDATTVAQEMAAEMNISAESLSELKMPSLDELDSLMGWE